MDPILNPNIDRFILKPIKYDSIWEYYKKAESSFWTLEEIDLGQDQTDWKTLSSDEQHYISMVLAFFAASDGIVCENLAARFLQEVQIPEARCFYGFQIAMENIHAETYAQLIESIVPDAKKRTELFDAVKNVKSIREKAEWAIEYMESTTSSFGQRLVAFACVEGIFFSSSFAALFWIKKKGIMPGLTFSNELISRDEGLHCEFACHLHSLLQHQNQVDHTMIHQIIKTACEIEKRFVTESLPCRLLSMNREMMQSYVEYVADFLCGMLRVEKIYHTANPFAWMERISLQGKTNFFERRVSEYQKAGIVTSGVNAASTTSAFADFSADSSDF